MAWSCIRCSTLNEETATMKIPWERYALAFLGIVLGGAIGTTLTHTPLLPAIGTVGTALIGGDVFWLGASYIKIEVETDDESTEAEQEGSATDSVRGHAERHFVDEHPGALVRLYVSDNKDYQVAAAAGFCYIEAAEFAKGIVP